MDPNLFHLDWERTLEALVGIIVLSFLVERACALLFESRWWIRLFEDASLGETSDSQKTNNTSKSEKKDLMLLLKRSSVLSLPCLSVISGILMR
jgi:hypothetical protein